MLKNTHIFLRFRRLFQEYYIYNVRHNIYGEEVHWVWGSAQDKMGEAAGGVVCWFSVLSVLVLVEMCNGGITSSFVRKVEKTVDMPSQSDVFRAPPGYNAPQQVLSLSFIFTCAWQ